MTALQSDQLKEMKSINKLLEIAQMKHYLQEFEEDKFVPYSPSLAKNHSNYSQLRCKNMSESLQKCSSDRYRQTALNEEQSSAIYANLQDRQFIPEGSHIEAKNPMSNKFVNVNSTFYPSSSQNINETPTTCQYVKGNEIRPVFEIKKVKSNSVYLKSNKSQTIRELLNQMKTERANNRKIILSPLSPIQYRQEENPSVFSSNQMKEMRKYKNFLPFREDQRLLIQKIGQKESVWKRKFKESWQKRKHGLQNRKFYLKSPSK